MGKISFRYKILMRICKKKNIYRDPADTYLQQCSIAVTEPRGSGIVML